jgi:hypothetical protein
MSIDTRMGETDLRDYARQLLRAHGDKAIAEAAGKAEALADRGENEEADTWRRVAAAMKSLRGPHQG